MLLCVTELIHAELLTKSLQCRSVTNLIQPLLPFAFHNSYHLVNGLSCPQVPQQDTDLYYLVCDPIAKLKCDH